MHKRTFLLLSTFWVFLAAVGSGVHANESQVQSFDIVVYGSSSAGVTAAVQAAKMGKSVVLIAPGKHLGGMTSNGLGWVDIKMPKALGGLTSFFFRKVWSYYQNDSSWKWETKHPIKGQLVNYYPNVHLMWVLEPHIGERIFDAMANAAKVSIVRGERLNRNDGVKMDGLRIVEIAMESGLTFSGKMFIDATYEGDLMAASNVSYIVGREPNSLYQETLNGIHSNIPSNNNYIKIDPYVVEGDPQSGLLQRIYPNAGGSEGDGDKCVEAYNYRMCLTDVPQNRVAIQKPEGYDDSEYELVFRAIKALVSANNIFKFDLLPNRKTDANNNGLISTDYIGMSWDYAEADYATREQIAKKHEQWQRGLIWTLQNHPRVPVNVRQFYGPWGLPKDEFADNNNWPYELYVREARRMVSDVVIDEHTVFGNEAAQDSVGLTYYYVDSHSIKYIVNPDGHLATEGGIYKMVLKPFPISYGAIVPARGECENLLVPVCISASHAAYGAVRVEPTYMVLGQSAATAAALSIDNNVSLQDLPYDILRARLLADGQVLDWN